MSTPLYQQNELLKKRANVWEHAKALLDKAEKEDRDLNAEEKEQYDRMCSDMEELKTRSDREHHLAQIETDLNRIETRQAPRLDVASTAGAPEDAPEYRHALNHWLRTGDPSELRSMSVSVNADGGYAVSTPTLATIREFLTGANVVRGLAEVISASGPFKVPVETEQVTVSGVAELGTVLTDQAVLSIANFAPYDLSRITRVSQQLLSDTEFDVAAYIIRKLTKGAADEEERLAILGTGSNEPQGILTGSLQGASGGAIDYDGIMDLTYSVVEGYRRNANYLASDPVIRDIMKLKDSQNLPIWQRSVVAGQPDTLAGRPIRSSQFMPDHANGNKVLAFGDFQAAVLFVDFTGTSMQRLDEKYADTNEVGFKILHRFDSRIVDQRAVKHYLRTS